MTAPGDELERELGWPGWTGPRDYDGVPLAGTLEGRAWLDENETPDERRRRLEREWDLLI